MRDEYADLLTNKEYTPTTLKELQNKAFEWILERGGIVKDKSKQDALLRAELAHKPSKRPSG